MGTHNLLPSMKEISNIMRSEPNSKYNKRDSDLYVDLDEGNSKTNIEQTLPHRVHNLSPKNTPEV